MKSRSASLQICAWLLGLLLIGMHPAAWAQSARAASFCPGAGTYAAVYAGPLLEMGMPKRFTAMQMGFTGGVSLDDRVYLGIFGGGLITNDVGAQFSSQETNGERLEFLQRGTQFGAMVDYSPIGTSRFRILIGARLGYITSRWRNADADITLRGNGFLAAPTLGFELPLMQYTRLAVGAGYRITSDLKLPEEVNNLSGLFLFAVLRLGSF